ncbi:Ku protein [Komagataeibacter saccharivorans NRIC 0614]|uniref:non-homologous end joining protein Ku n=1 Tax=Komagataeibacter saccharivorans TaxID=265959 RepID=UPI001C65290B|nr:Ku protein [Komagataeibacter saccharivorans]GBQ43192.1 Ku protein [Komagataeibacter saccharivorans NRIC 0614]
MVARASWKGILAIGELTCPVALYAAVSASERVTLHLINRRTGNRVHRHYIDSKDGTEVDRDDQVRGYETQDGEIILLEPGEIAAAVPDSDRRLALSAFVRCSEVDDVYLDRPYYLCPAEPAAGATLALIHDSLARQKVAALTTTVLFRRVRTLLIRAHDDRLIATTLNFDDEVRPAQDAFRDIPGRDCRGKCWIWQPILLKRKRGISHRQTIPTVMKPFLRIWYGQNWPAKSRASHGVRQQAGSSACWTPCVKVPARQKVAHHRPTGTKTVPAHPVPGVGQADRVARYLSPEARLPQNAGTSRRRAALRCPEA